MQYIHLQKSWIRWFRQLIFMPFLQNQWLTSELKHELIYTIAHAESGHRGEICLIIENSLPLKTAYWQDCRMRAIALFSDYRVWDTKENTGILIYVNVCEKALEIVADRGIDNKLPVGYWHEICQTAIKDFQVGQMQVGLFWLIETIGELLRHYYPSFDGHGDERSNRPVYL